MQDISIIVALLSGVVSFFAPCIIPLLPAYISYVTGVSIKELRAENGVEKYKREIVSSSLWYVLGFSLLFMLMGTTAASLGSVFRQNRDVVELLGGILIMIFSLHFMGLIRIPIFSSGFHLSLPKWVNHLGKARAFIMGMIFAVAWTPCVGAVLGAILTLAAASQTATAGALLLLFYSLGISIPFLFVSVLILKTPKLLKLIQKYMVVVSKISGILLFMIGFLLFNNAAELFGDYLTYDGLNAWLFRLARGFGYKIK